VDQWEKRTILRRCFIGYMLLSAGYVFLTSSTAQQSLTVSATEAFVYAGFFVNGIIRSFLGPSSFSLLGLLVPRRLYSNATTWSSTSWQTGTVIGPLLGGMLIAFLPVPVSLVSVFILQLLAFFAISRIPRQPVLNKIKEPALKSLREGLRFVFSTQLILAVLALDMFAVLFGGATALLPAFARDILDVGEIGFGWLRAAPGIGAIVTFSILIWMPLRKKPGIKLLFSIAGFGTAIVVFGLSRNFYLSMLMLLISGMLDAVSVVIRSTILQLHTPDEMRGRVSAINTMFISSSNEIGEVESGLTAKWMGTVPAVIFGGCMTIAVVIATYFVAPGLRTLKLEPGEKKSE
jgi:MFS family permease